MNCLKTWRATNTTHCRTKAFHISVEYGVKRQTITWKDVKTVTATANTLTKRLTMEWTNRKCQQKYANKKKKKQMGIIKMLQTNCRPQKQTPKYNANFSIWISKGVGQTANRAQKQWEVDIRANVDITLLLLRRERRELEKWRSLRGRVCKYYIFQCNSEFHVHTVGWLREQ